MSEAPKKPYQLYSLGTPNGFKVSIFLEEAGLEYDAHTIDIRTGAQKEPSFTAINPNGRIPALVDLEAPGGPFNVFESGAILLYLAEKTGKFIPTDVRKRSEVIQWLFWQMAGLGPMFGQCGHFHKYAPLMGENNEYGKKRYLTETRRLLEVLDKRLEGREYVCDEYSIADISIWPWIGCLDVGYGLKDVIPLSAYPNVERWRATIGARPAVQRGCTVCPFPATQQPAVSRALFGLEEEKKDAAPKEEKSEAKA
eukprot:TRINITY_DN6135_c0_g1_i1.p1 TRINITY_DN6135_c0_g1~~TRINITY_DN6135_c0_g1_i1.p1  ORF type:complete len:269 (-),score=41.03 TRINITY_DN6135_c0_g1_i1:48-809(-)